MSDYHYSQTQLSEALVEIAKKIDFVATYTEEASELWPEELKRALQGQQLELLLIAQYYLEVIEEAEPLDPVDTPNPPQSVTKPSPPVKDTSAKQNTGHIHVNYTGFPEHVRNPDTKQFEMYNPTEVMKWFTYNPISGLLSVRHRMGNIYPGMDIVNWRPPTKTGEQTPIHLCQWV